MTLLSVDVGSSHIKAGLFDTGGTPLRIASRATPVRSTSDGDLAIDGEELWRGVAAALAEVLSGSDDRPVAAVGVTSMAETGLLVDRATGRPKTEFVPWFDRGAAPQAETIGQTSDAFAIFRRSGLRASHKCGLAKLLWLRDREPSITRDAVWLSAADFVAMRLTGQQATDPTLAARTLAYDLAAGEWDADWLAEFELDPASFPPILPSGQPVGVTCGGAAASISLRAGIPVAICGHDHVAASLLAGGQGQVLDSLGTAEAIVGTLARRPLSAEDLASGLVFGPHVLGDRLFWMGALSASGGSLDWLRRVLGDPPLTYEALCALLDEAGPGVVQIIYLPHLLGAQAPWPDRGARGAFVGLTAAHGRSDMAKAVLQGVAYEMAYILTAAEAATGERVHTLVAGGGGSRIPLWLQIRADVTGRPVEALSYPEATLVGAAMLAGAGVHGSGSLDGRIAAALRNRAPLAAEQSTVYRPDAGRHEAHRRLLEAYRALQTPLRAAAQAFTE